MFPRGEYVGRIWNENTSYYSFPAATPRKNKGAKINCLDILIIRYNSYPPLKDLRRSIFVLPSRANETNEERKNEKEEEKEDNIKG